MRTINPGKKKVIVTVDRYWRWTPSPDDKSPPERSLFFKGTQPVLPGEKGAEAFVLVRKEVQTWLPGDTWWKQIERYDRRGVLILKLTRG